MTTLKRFLVTGAARGIGRAMNALMDSVSMAGWHKTMAAIG